MIAPDGRVAVIAGRSVHVLAPDLRPLASRSWERAPRAVCFTRRGLVALSWDGFESLDGGTVPPDFAKRVSPYSLDGFLELPDGTWLAWNGSHLARLDPLTGVRTSPFVVESSMSSSRRVAVAPNGRVWSLMAMSWSSQDEATEYHAQLCAFTPSGRLLLHRGHDAGVPTSTGLATRLIATEYGALAGETAVARFSVTGTTYGPIEHLPAPGARICVAPAHDRAFFADGSNGVASLALHRTVIAEPRPIWVGDATIRDLVVDGAGHLYLATESAVIAIDAERGDELWRVEPLPAHSLALGEGFLLCTTGGRSSGSIVRIH